MPCAQLNGESYGVRARFTAGLISARIESVFFRAGAACTIRPVARLFSSSVVGPGHGAFTGLRKAR